MRYCLNSRQNPQILKLCDEIMVASRDYRQITDLFNDYPDKIIILNLNNEDLEDENKMNIVKQYSEISNNFCCCIYNLQHANWFRGNEIKFYYGFPVNSFYDVRGLIDLGVEYIKITAPLTFNMTSIEKIKVKFRAVPNVAYDAYIPRQNGIHGQYIRPEDVEFYDKGIYVFEFENADLRQEEVLFKVYCQKKEWKDDLSILITNFNFQSNSSAYPDLFGAVRSTCRQRCMEDKDSCHYCDRAVRFEPIIKQYIKEKKEEN